MFELRQDLLITVPCARAQLAAVLRYALLSLLMLAAPVRALGLGELQVHSKLGQHLQADLPILGNEGEEILSSCVKARIMNPDGSFISALQVKVEARRILLRSPGSLYEPAFHVQVNLECQGRIERSWPVLLDLSEALSTTEPVPPVVAQSSRRRANPPTSSLPLPVSTSSASATSPGAGPAPAPARSRDKQGKRQQRNVLQISTAADSAEAAEIERLVLNMSRQLSSQSLEKLQAGTAPKTVDAGTAETPVAPHLAQELGNMQQKIRMLEAEAKRLQERSQDQDRLLQQEAAAQGGRPWLWALSLMLLTAIAAIVWLGTRIRQLQDKRHFQAESAFGNEPEFAAPVLHHVRPPAPAAPGVAVNQKASHELPPQPNGIATDASILTATRPVQAPFTDEGRASRNMEEAPPAPGSEVEDEPALLEFEAPLPVTDSELSLPSVDELTDVMHEAEFWMALGKIEKAAEVLEMHGQSEYIHSPATWLYLFELYRRLDERDKYDNLAQRFRHRFNARIPSWEEDDLFATQPGLEQMPTLLQKITLLWGTSQLIPLLEDLIVDNREGMRTGFALPVYRELLFLLDLAHHLQQDKEHDALEFA